MVLRVEWKKKTRSVNATQKSADFFRQTVNDTSFTFQKVTYSTQTIFKSLNVSARRYRFLTNSTHLILKLPDSPGTPDFYIVNYY